VAGIRGRGTARGGALPWRFLRRPSPWLPLIFSGLVGLQGCDSLAGLQGETLNVMIVTQRRLEWLRHEAIRQKLWDPLLEEYQNVHPNVRVNLSTVDENVLVEELKLRTSRGLGPDLLLLRAPMANTLLKAGLIAPVPQTPAMRRTIASVDPRFLKRVGHGSRLAGLPLHDLVTLACFNRQKVPYPPRTTDELMAMAAAGRAIGLSIDPYGIWWTAGTRGADRAIAPILTGTVPSSSNKRGREREVISAWLVWLREVAQQSRVDIASGPQDLFNGLVASRLDWIPCFSLTLAPLRKAMGPRLGVTALPSGPGGAPSPFSILQVWAFGLDSSPRQRQNAAALTRLSVDPMLQRRYVLDSEEVLPVNRFVPTPVASSGVLAALAEAEQQFQSGSPLLTQPFTTEHLHTMTKRIESVIQQVMLGVLTPQEAAAQLLDAGPTLP
jgi:arabinogalactan oligomer/maltooligosaccharide transport system substrate-binding protein